MNASENQADFAEHFLRNMMSETFGPNGPPVLMAITPDNRPGIIVWAAFSTWSDPYEFASEISSPGCPTHVIDWNNATQAMFETVRDTLKESDQDKIVIGVSESGEWLSWELALTPQRIPSF